MEDGLPERFRQFAERKCTGRIGAPSSLYEHLSLEIADDRDPDLLALAANARDEQPTPNLLFAAVQSLLFETPDSPLAAYYLSVGAETRPIDERTYPTFREFCLEHEAEIVDLLSTRRVQTNAVRRSACLLPAFEYVSRRVERTPLALVEIGSSVGLNLLWISAGTTTARAARTETRAHQFRFRANSAGKSTHRSRQSAHPSDRGSGSTCIRSTFGETTTPRGSRRSSGPNTTSGGRSSRTQSRSRGTRTRGRNCEPATHSRNSRRSSTKYPPSRRFACTIPTCSTSFRTLSGSDSTTSSPTSVNPETCTGCEWVMDIATPLIHCYRFEDGVHGGDLLARFHGHGSWLQWLHEER